MKRSLAKNVTLLASAALILAAGVAFFTAVQGVKQEVNVMTAAKDIASYTVVADDELKAVPVPKASVTDEALTEDEYKKQFTDKDEPLIATMDILANQRLDERLVAKDARASFAIVSPDERIIAVTASLQGAAIGTVHAGDIVDVRQDGSTGAGEGVGSNFAKVVCIAAEASGCKGVLPPGVQLSVKEDGESGNETRSGDGNVTVLLAVPTADAPAIAGKSVALALNPFCKVGVNDAEQGITPDMFVSAREDDAAACEVPAGRAASTGTAEGSSDASTPDAEATPAGE